MQRIPRIVALIPAILAPVSARAGEPVTPSQGKGDEQAVRDADGAFWMAFNNCDRAGMAARFTSDVEFYHDRTGLTRSRDAVTASMFAGPCSDPAALRLRREPAGVDGRFYPLAGGFALLEGEHRFFATRSGQSERHDSKARYAELWERGRDGTWRMRRVVSFDHRADEPALAGTPLLPGEARRYVGSYVAEDGGTMVVSDADGLRVASGNAVFPLVRLAPGRFGTPGRWLEFRFDRDALVILEEGRPVARGRRVPGP